MQNLFSYLDVAMLLGLIFVWLGRKLGLNLLALGAGVGVLALVCLIPVNGLMVYMYPRALIGDLSMTSKAFLATWLLYRLGGPIWADMREVGFVMRTMAVVGLVFYPLALGLTSYDPYSAGYSASRIGRPTTI